MIAFIDIGNSVTKLLLSKNKLVKLKTSQLKSAEVWKKLKNYSEVLIASVVPDASKKLQKSVPKNMHVHFINADDVPLSLAYANTLGVDRALNILGALAIQEGSFVVVSFGTTVTVDFWDDKKQKHLGGWIGIGPSVSKLALSKHTAQLPLIDAPSQEIEMGRSTKECLAAGWTQHFVGLMERASAVAHKRWGTAFTIIVTGNDCPLFIRRRFKYKESLVLSGLKVLSTLETMKACSCPH